MKPDVKEKGVFEKVNRSGMKNSERYCSRGWDFIQGSGTSYCSVCLHCHLRQRHCCPVAESGSRRDLHQTKKDSFLGQLSQQ